MTEYERLTLVIAGAALAISVASAMWTVGWSVWIYLRPHRPRLTVTVRGGISIALGPDVYWLFATITNSSPVGTTVGGVCLRTDRTGAQGIYPPEWMHGRVPWPVWLEPGASIEVPMVAMRPMFIELSERFGRHAWWKLSVVATDSTNREHLGTFRVQASAVLSGRSLTPDGPTT